MNAIVNEQKIESKLKMQPTINGLLLSLKT
jgi:hypothetical protein